MNAQLFHEPPTPAWIGYIDSTDLSNRVPLKSVKHSFKWHKTILNSADEFIFGGGGGDDASLSAAMA